MDQATDVSRVLFGFAAAYHYLFVPLTIGLIAIVAIVDAMALCTRRQVWAEAGHFWSRLFLLNFVCGAVTGWPLRYLLEQQWTRYAHAVQEVFAWAFGIEGRIAPVMLVLVIVMAFRTRMPAAVRSVVSALLALVLIAQSSAILVLNAWMQNPVGVEVLDGNFKLVDPSALLSNPMVFPKILHTVAAAYVLGGMFVLSVSAWCLLRGRHRAMAVASMRIAASFTLVSLGLTGLAGHWSGERVARYQPAKFAGLEALWEAEPSPATLTLFALPDAASRSNHYALKLPYVLGWVAQSDPNRPLLSAAEVVRDAELALQSAVKRGAPPRGVALPIDVFQRDYGVLGLLDVPSAHATSQQISQAAQRAMPPVAPLFWGFRVMVGVWVALMALVACVAWRIPDARRRKGRRLLWACVIALPLPWIATEAGWMVCELGRQPWTVTGALATSHSRGAVNAGQTALALVGWGCAYAVLLVANIVLSLRWIRLGRLGLSPVRTASRQDKQRAVAAARRAGATVAATANDYGISEDRLRRWIRQLDGVDLTAEEGEAALLRQQVKRLRVRRAAMEGAARGAIALD